MKKIFLAIFLFFCLGTSFGEVISGKINHDDISYKNRIVDFNSGKGLQGAKITIPDLNYTVYSDENGAFQLNAEVSDKTVLFVEKEGYKTFSLTIDNNVLKNPLKLGIEKSNPFDIQVSIGIVHLGDNMFSLNSANSGEFQNFAKGAEFTQKFSRPQYSKDGIVIVKIGSLIGLDTKRAKESGQNRIAKVYASPAEVYVNGRRIKSLELNGDNIEVEIPKNILREENELSIRTGKNLFQTNYTDYDDIELANIRVEVKEKHTISHY